MYVFEEVYKRKPDNWRDWRYGMSHIERMHAQEAYTIAKAVRMGQAEEAGYTKYSNLLRIAAGYTRS